MASNDKVSPDDVLTPGGWRPKSDVHELTPDQVVNVENGRLTIIDKKSRTLIRDLGPITPTKQTTRKNGLARTSSVETGPHPAPLTDQWIVYSTWTNASANPISYFKARWTVPAAPSTNHGQTIFLFNGLTPLDNAFILQPVLQWGVSSAGGGAYWSITNWYVGTSTVLSMPLVEVSPGQVLDGIMTLTGDTGSNRNYQSAFTGYPSQTLTVNNVGTLKVADVTLECYGVQAFTDYPATSHTDFTTIEIRLRTSLSPFTEVQASLAWTANNVVTDNGQQCIIRNNSSPNGAISIYTRGPWDVSPAIYSLTISGDDKYIEEGWSLSPVLNGHGSFTFSILSVHGTYWPSIGEEVVFTRNGVPLFGGYIQKPAVRGIGERAAIVTRVTAEDYNALADRRFVVNGGFPEGFTLLAALNSLVGYLAPYGVIVDPAQVTGPTLPLLGYDVRSIASILDELSVITGFVWRIDARKRLRMFAPGEITAPVVLTSTNGVAIEDVTVESERERYATRIIVQAGTGTVDLTATWTATAGQTVFPLTYRLASHYGNIQINGAGGELIGAAPPYWVVNTSVLPHTLTRATGLNAGDTVSLVYTAQFPYTAIADSGAPPEDMVEQVIVEKDVFSADVANALADGYLARAQDVSQVVQFSTRVWGFEPGQVVGISVGERALSGFFLITEAPISHTIGDSVITTVTATGGSLYHGSWRDDVKNWSSGSSGSLGGGGVSISTGSASVGSGTIGTVSKWVTATTLGDSLLQEFGTTITVNGGLQVAGNVTALLYTGSGAGLTELQAPQLVGNMPWVSLPAGVGTWTGIPTITGSVTLNDQLSVAGSATVGGQVSVGGTITTPPLTNLRMSPTGDLVLDPSGKDVLPGVGYDINLGALSNKYLALHAAELWVETLVAQNTLATIGGRVLVSSTNILALDLAPSNTTITVKYNSLAVGDTLYMEANGQVEFMVVTAVVGTAQVPWLLGGTISLMFAPAAATYTAYTYSVTRNADGTGANQWYAGDALLNTGQVGDGFIDLYSLRGVKSGTEIGPSIVGNVRTSTAYNGWAPRWAIGNLNGLYGYGVTTYGAGFGDASAANLVIDATSGIRIRQGTTTYAQMAASIFRLGLTSGNRVEWDGTNMTIVSSTVSMNSTGLSVAAPSTTYDTLYSYRFVPNATIGGTSFGMFAKNADSANRYLGIQNITTSNGKNSWIEMIATGKTTGGANVNASLSLFSDGAVTANSSITLSAASITLGGTALVTGGATVQGPSGLAVNYSTILGTGATVDPLLIQVAGTNRCRFDTNGDLRPETDNTIRVGLPTHRLTLVRAVTITAGDLGFENGWALTEGYKVGVSEPGVAVVNATGEVVAFFGDTGFYAKTPKDVDDLPFALTTSDQRARMDMHPHTRVKGVDVDGIPVFKTASDVLPLPVAADIKTTRERKRK